jgi:putative membrane protein
MMWYSEGQPGWGGWTLMLVSMLILWGLLIWGIGSVLRPGPGGDKISPDRSPEQLLAHRFAAGEIDADAYRRGLDVLAGNDRRTDDSSHR